MMKFFLMAIRWMTIMNFILRISFERAILTIGQLTVLMVCMWLLLFAFPARLPIRIVRARRVSIVIMGRIEMHGKIKIGACVWTINCWLFIGRVGSLFIVLYC